MVFVIGSGNNVQVNSFIVDRELTVIFNSNYWVLYYYAKWTSAEHKKVDSIVLCPEAMWMKINKVYAM